MDLENPFTPSHAEQNLNLKKPEVFKHRQKQVTLDKFLVEDGKRKENPEEELPNLSLKKFRLKFELPSGIN